MNLPHHQEIEVKEAIDALLQRAAHNPQQDINPETILEAVEGMNRDMIHAVVMGLLAVEMSLALAFQRAVYAQPPNLINLAAAGMASARVSAIIGTIATHEGGIFDRDATARRASWIAGEMRAVAITSTAAQIILPGAEN